MSHTMNLFDPKPYTAKHTLYDPWSNRRSLSLSPRTYLALERLRVTLARQSQDAMNMKENDKGVRSPKPIRRDRGQSGAIRTGP